MLHALPADLHCDGFNVGFLFLQHMVLTIWRVQQSY